MKRVRQGLAVLILAASAWYIYRHIPGGWGALTAELYEPANLRLLAWGSVALAAGNLLLGCGWYFLMRAVMSMPLNFRDVWRDYAAAHVLRYLGGYWGGAGIRHVGMRRKYQLANSALLSVAFLEAAMLLGASSLLALPLALDRWTSLLQRTEIGLTAAVVAALCAWRIRKIVADKRALAGAALAYTTFTVVNSLVFVAVFHTAPQSWITLAAAYNLSWLVGQLTPGAVQGLGVREAVVVSLLVPGAGTGTALLGAVLFRIMLVGGDALFFLAAYLPQHRKAEAAKDEGPATGEPLPCFVAVNRRPADQNA